MNAPPDAAPPRKSIIVGVGGTFIVLILVMLSLFSVAMVVRDIGHKHDVATWPETTAVVFGSRIDDIRHDPQAEGRFRWRPTISFTYEIDGERFKTDNKRLVEPMTRADAEAVIAQYPPQQPFTLYYDPEDPEDVTFDDDPPWIRGETFGFLVPSMMFWIFFGGWLVPAMLRNRRARRASALDAR